MSKQQTATFEETLSRLEAIVKELEEEDLPLEKAIDLYEEGIKLSHQCTETLEKAEQRIINVQAEPDNS